MTMRRTALGLVAAAVLAAGAGCLFVAAGAAAGGTLAYVKGELQETLASPIEPATAAAEKAMAKLGLTTEVASKSGLVSQFVAHLADGTKVVVKLESLSAQTTRVGVRVGLVGDRALSARVLGAIKENL